MQYKRINLNSKLIIDKYIKKTQILTSDYALPVILTWEDLKDPEYSEYNETLFIRGFLNGRRIYFPPLTSNSFAEAVDILIDYTSSQGEELEIILAIKEQINQLNENRFEFVTNRDYSEYIYNSEDLINLTGKKYHSKRNHINTFNRKYKYEFRSYEKADYDEVIDLLHRWSQDKDENPSIEINMVKYFLKYMDELEIFADVIVIDNKIIGTAIGESSNPVMGIVMYEKCDYNYDGSCAAINQMFSEKHFSNIQYINRQEDIGIPGLRKAKLSYKPERLVHRYSIKLK